MEPPGLLDDGLGRIIEGVRAPGRPDGEAQPARRDQTPEQKELLERLTAVMSLLEGHADVVMDGVGPR